MKTKHIVIIALLAAPSMQAASIQQADPAAGGIGYVWSVTLNGSDSILTPDLAIANVGAWSWEDQGLFGLGEPTRGWTHTSNWAAIELTSAAYFTLSLAGNTNIPLVAGGFRPADHFFPSFSIYSGWDNDAMSDAVAASLGLESGDNDSHTYNNRGDIDWAEDLTFLGKVENSTLSSVQGTWLLPAGKYSIAMGSNASASLAPPRQGYVASFSASPIPEPSSSGLAVLALAGMILRRRR